MINNEEREYIIKKAYQRGLNAGVIIGVSLTLFAYGISSLTNYIISL